MKNARPAAHPENARPMMPKTWLRIERSYVSRLAFRGWMHHPQSTHRHAKSRRRVRAEVTPGNAGGRRARVAEATASSVGRS